MAVPLPLGSTVNSSAMTLSVDGLLAGLVATVGGKVEPAFSMPCPGWNELASAQSAQARISSENTACGPCSTAIAVQAALPA